MSAILITGANGFVGGHVARRLIAAGATAVGIGNDPPPYAGCASSHRVLFGQPLSGVLSATRVDAAIHCAHDLSPAGAAISEAGTKQWAQELTSAGVTRQVFISSISARPDARAPYGQTKYRLEQWFAPRQAVILRLGLVIGNGGLFGRLIRLIRRLLVVPVLAGRARVYFTGIDFAGEQIARSALDWPGAGLWNLQQPEPTTVRELLGAIRDALGVGRLLPAVPYGPCVALAWLLDRCGLRRLGVSYDNLVGLRQNDVPGLRSDFVALGGKPESLCDLVRRAVASADGRLATPACDAAGRERAAAERRQPRQ